jgi:hypothetical protein
MSRFINRKPKLQAELWNTLARLGAFLAPLDGSGTLRRRVEAGLVARLWASGAEVTVLLEPRRRGGRQLTGQPPVRVRSCGCTVVPGLSCEFDA